VIIRRPTLRAYRLGYWGFFAAKTLAIMIAVPVFWIEFAELYRSWVPPSEFRVITTGMLFRVIFVLAFSCAILWSFLDQRKRCPVCLQILGMPVRIGSSASIFDPVRTELLCEQGHGLLCITAVDDGEDDQWTTLDQSWQDLFSTKVS